MKEIVFYQTKDGKTPLINWLKSLSIDYRSRVLKRINRIKDGNFGDCKRLRNSQLSELRLWFGKGYRVYYKELNDVIVLFIAGGDKSDQKQIIKQANEYFEEYLNRSNSNDNKF